MMNLMIKRDYLASENKRLLEKSKKIDAIVDTLKTQGADQMEINEVKAMMSQDELSLLASFNDHSNK
jgi:DNA-directed RNA polymerase III subunit RPC3